MLREERRLQREEQTRREANLTETLRQREEDLQRLQTNSTVQLSPSNNIPSREPNLLVANVGEGDMRAVDFKLKPDIFDGTAPLREFFSQFELIARANRWSDATETIALASNLRGKARSILETVEDIEYLEFSELKSKLELPFGEGHLFHSSYSQFVNRRQKFGEDLAALGSDLERLSRLAYPE